MFQSPLFWIILLALMNVVWGGSHAIVKYGLNFTDPLNLVFWRYFVAIVILIAWILIRKIKFKFSRNELIRIAGAGICTGLTQIFWVTGINMSMATDSSLLFVFEPVWGIILASIFLKEKMLKTTVIGTVITILGLAYLSNLSSANFSFGKQSLALGNLIIVISLLSEGFFSIIINPVAKKHSPQTVITGVLIVSFITVLIPLLFTSNIKFSTSTGFIIPVLYLSVLCSVIGYTMWIAVMKHVPVSIMLFTVFIQPVSGPIIAMLFIGEKIGLRTIYGGFLLLAGTFVAILGHVLKTKKKSTIAEGFITTNPSNPAI